MRTPTILALALCLAGCSAPRFHQPPVAIPEQWKEAQLPDGSRWQAAPAALPPQGAWWRAFDDPGLDDLIARATAANQDLAVALARVRQARALAGVAEADRAPQVGLGVGAARTRQAPLELQLPAGTPVAAANVYHATLSASYEADLFARVSSQVAAARSDLGASAAGYRAVLLSLQADVAQTWFRLRALDAELAAVAHAVALRAQSLNLTERRFALGDIGEFDVARARTELATARSDAIGLQQQRAAAEHALAILLGIPPAQLNQPANPLVAGGFPVIPPGLPSSLLQRRPDLQAAQQAMEAANARIGVARATRFPALVFQTGAGGVAGNLADVFSWSSRSWLVGAAMSMPLIDGGRNRARIDASTASLDEAVAQFRGRVLAAYGDVEDNLSNLRVLAGQSGQVDAALVSARRSAELATHLYAAGRTSYLDQLDAERALSTIDRQAAQLRGSQAIATVALIRALGGGWDTNSPPEPHHD